MSELTDEERKWHRSQAVVLFNMVWDYMGMAGRSQADDDTMINAAHASRYHWQLVGNEQNLSIGDWQISRVYALLKRAEPALYHGRRCLAHAVAGALAPFYVAYGHEAIARAAGVAGNTDELEAHRAQALALLPDVEDEEDGKALESDLATLI